MLYGDALAEVVTGLRNAGINATTEPSEIQLPGAFVAPGTMTFDILDGESYSAEIEIHLLTSNKGTVQSINDLQGLLTTLRTVFEVPEALPQIHTLPNIAGNDPVPGLLIILQATID